MELSREDGPINMVNAFVPITMRNWWLYVSGANKNLRGVVDVHKVLYAVLAINVAGSGHVELHTSLKSEGRVWASTA